MFSYFFFFCLTFSGMKWSPPPGGNVSCMIILFYCVWKDKCGTWKTYSILLWNRGLWKERKNELRGWDNHYLQPVLCSTDSPLWAHDDMISNTRAAHIDTCVVSCKSREVLLLSCYNHRRLNIFWGVMWKTNVVDHCEVEAFFFDIYIKRKKSEKCEYNLYSADFNLIPLI